MGAWEGTKVLPWGLVEMACVEGRAIRERLVVEKGSRKRETKLEG